MIYLPANSIDREKRKYEIEKLKIAKENNDYELISIDKKGNEKVIKTKKLDNGQQDFISKIDDVILAAHQYVVKQAATDPKFPKFSEIIS